jgi:dTDP-4-dehydro-6-deoxy-alpha-D-glucopyranose 2,3-dehydratase
MFGDLLEFDSWFAHRRKMNEFAVEQVPLEQLAGWRFAAGSGNLVHATGRFFAVEGTAVETDHREVESWQQPIIRQPEIGILGILVKRFDGVPYCLMQAKMEPGNINVLQLSPTVQATRSNYTGVHRGSAVPYLEHFLAPTGGRLLFDALQSEQGAWFVAKRNRNMVVEVAGEVAAREDFCWLSFPQLHRLLLTDNVVNMDSRTVLAGLPPAPEHGPDPTPPGGSGPALHSTARLLSWFTEMKSRYRLHRRPVPLAGVAGWAHVDGRIRHDSGRFFTVLGVDVSASSREVTAWSQPMIAPCGRGVVAFVGRYIDGVFHLLVHALTEAGTFDVVEMAPTVRCVPENYAALPPERRPLFLDYVLGADPGQIRLDVVQSEEGGRFYHAENRYLLVEAGDDFPVRVPEDYVWMTVAQLAGFVWYGNHVDVTARSLLACMNALTPVAAC